MERDLRIRFWFSRGGVVKILALSFLGGLPTALEPQPNPAQSVVFNFDFPEQPVGAFGSLAVQSGQPILLTRNGALTGSRVGVGDIGGANPNSDMVVMGPTVIGANNGGVGALVLGVRNDPSSPFVRPASIGFVSRDLGGGAGGTPWNLRVSNEPFLGGAAAFSHFLVNDTSNINGPANPRIFSIDGNGSMVLCNWRAVTACPAREVDMFTAGVGTNGGVGTPIYAPHCPPSGPNNASYCCSYVAGMPAPEPTNGRHCTVPAGIRWRLCCTIQW